MIILPRTVLIEIFKYLTSYLEFTCRENVGDDDSTKRILRYMIEVLLLSKEFKNHVVSRLSCSLKRAYDITNEKAYGYIKKLYKIGITLKLYSLQNENFLKLKKQPESQIYFNSLVNINGMNGDNYLCSSSPSSLLDYPILKNIVMNINSESNLVDIDRSKVNLNIKRLLINLNTQSYVLKESLFSLFPNIKHLSIRSYRGTYRMYDIGNSISSLNSLNSLKLYDVGVQLYDIKLIIQKVKSFYFAAPFSLFSTDDLAKFLKLFHGNKVVELFFLEFTRNTSITLESIRDLVNNNDTLTDIEMNTTSMVSDDNSEILFSNKTLKRLVLIEGEDLKEYEYYKFWKGISNIKSIRALIPISDRSIVILSSSFINLTKLYLTLSNLNDINLLDQYLSLNNNNNGNGCKLKRLDLNFSTYFKFDSSLLSKILFKHQQIKTLTIENITGSNKQVIVDIINSNHPSIKSFTAHFNGDVDIVGLVDSICNNKTIEKIDIQTDITITFNEIIKRHIQILNNNHNLISLGLEYGEKRSPKKSELTKRCNEFRNSYSKNKKIVEFKSNIYHKQFLSIIQDINSDYLIK